MRRSLAFLMCAVSVLGVSLGLVGCGKPAPKGATGPAAPDPADAPELRVHPDNADLVYRYFPSGVRKPETVTRIEDVPAEYRKMVLVIPPEAPPGLSYVADLQSAEADGTYPYKVVPTNELDRTLDESRGTGVPTGGAVATVGSANAAPTAPAPAASADDVVMFSASWCGVCGKAKRWFRNKGIAFKERDVEKDPRARSDMERMAREANFPPSRLSGVPVIWVKGKMFSGFDPRGIEQALRGS